ncbi:hypothetical protein DI005_21980 [Prauserella sp. PE36]|uniref:Uncharacterized protein n=1 Tax=Prauserella endophytica TaxID=1592324 RepID=A0ABY2RZU7_9PSEU|nr:MULTISPECIES: hypothetical protein [Prauserella]PXY20280.1 hypothetical protein BAY59_31035 [Prauserella coralliicola]RBM17367.1 hypothetical protein DI005_21980 [Prauserella sp. PE36]TKG66883.1 hypothetical protein FCN18_23480 [Prauserella endophytica]
MTEDKPGEDPTAEFLDSVRAEEPPWRVDRPPEAEQGTTYAAEEQKLSRARQVAKAVGDAAPFVPLATAAGWVAAEALDDVGDGADPGLDPGAGLT